MPRFTEQEKEIINRKLLIEGEKLFAAHGLKKVTVDDLVAAVNISKGSFYAFYPSKEHLYVEINFRLQKELFTNIETTIKGRKYENHRDLDIFDSHMHNDIHILEMLEDLGVIFTIPHTVIIKSLYSVLSCLEQFKEDKELNMIQNLLVNGIVQQVVAE